jgi:hypothetical protein
MSPRGRKRTTGARSPGNRSTDRRRQRGRGQGGQGGQGGRGQAGGAGYWGEGATPPEPGKLRITEDPTALVRSLGPAPLPGHELIAEGYFTAVYDRAIMLAGALAAAGGLTTAEELQDSED